ncbi:NACHT domain-containing protein [Paraburkholderia sediminicola]|uniref:hypothetical protein n=1 Tax=Paraburkholderia sediminicola TaxID=458836 RepID=UPI0038B9E4BF
MVLKLLEVVRGGASALCFEGTADAFAGFEFLLVKGVETQWHQVKVSNTSGNWTANRLRSLGVLESFRRRLSLDDTNDRCHFISQDPAVTLRDLTERARTARDYKDFQPLLTIALADDFQVITDAWNVDREVAFTWLQRIHCRIQPEDGLDEAIEAFGPLCFSHDGALVFSALREYMEQRFNRHLTTDIVRDELPQFGVALKHWQLDRTLTERLHSSTEDYLVSYAPVAADKLIPRKESQRLLDELLKPEGANVILLTGAAGSGKSGLVKQLIAELRSLGIVNLALRADQFLNIGTKEDIGRQLTARDESPVVTLKGVCGTSLGVLVVDQVDAVSEVSGRDTRLKAHILRMLGDAETFGTVKVVCACRAFDLDNDARLKTLTAQKSVQRIDISPLNWESEVRPLLRVRGVDTERLSPSQKGLLELPLNLGIFLEVHDDGQSFNSRNDLFGRLLAKKTRVIARDRAPGWSVAQPLEALVKWMSDRQTLQAPLSSLHRFDSASDILASENLITVRGSKVHFFHESFFDYLFARRFVNESQTLVELLLSDEQHLFRRTQVRQILESLREDDRTRYVKELDELLTHPGIRFHIKLAVAQWLGMLANPSAPELQTVLKLSASDERFPVLVRSTLFRTAGWFDVACSVGLPQRELYSSSETRCEDALWWLSQAAAHRPAQVLSLLERWYEAAETEKRAGRLLDWFALLRGASLDEQMLPMLHRLLETSPRAFFGKENGFRVSAIFDSLMRLDATNLVPVAKAYFRKWFEVNPTGHPFSNERELEVEPFSKLANSSPCALVEATIDALRATIARITGPAAPPYDQTFRSRRPDEHYTVAGKFLVAFRTALECVAVENPKAVESWLDTLVPSAHEVLLHLHLRAIVANGAALAHRLLPLLGEAALFDAGWSNAPHQAFTDAARAALPHLRADERLLVEDKVLADRSELDFTVSLLSTPRRSDERATPEIKARAISILRYTGHQQWVVLEGIGDALLSVDAQSRLALLRRKFHGSGQVLQHSRHSGFAHSPIPESAAPLISDESWLEAIAKYEVKERLGGRRPLDAGSEQLSTHLHQLAKQHPARFAALIQKIPCRAPAIYVRRILHALGEADVYGAELQIVHALLSAHNRPGHPFGEEIANVLQKRPDLASDDALYDALCWYAVSGGQPASQHNPRRPVEPTASIEDLLSHNDGLISEAWSGVRGGALHALSHVIRVLPKRRATAGQLLEQLVANEPELSVRSVVVAVLTAFFPQDKSLCARLLEELAMPAGMIDASARDRNLSVLATRFATGILPAMVRDMPTTGERLILGMLGAKDDAVRAVGGWYVLSASFYYDHYIKRADQLLVDMPAWNGLAADAASEAIVKGELTQRAYAAISTYFDSEDKQVRDKAREVFRNIGPDNFGRSTALARKYVDSAAFTDDSFVFFHALDKATCAVTELVVIAAERLVNMVIEGNTANQRATDLHQLRDLLSREYVATEHSPELRKRLLDVLDTMLAHEMYGADDVLKAHERD